jgi:ferrous iron transport protein A
MLKWIRRVAHAPSDGARRPADGPPRKLALGGSGWKAGAAAHDHQPGSRGGIPLSTLRTGDRATVLEVDVSTPVGRRLLDLGFIPETEVRVVRRSPFGDPIAFYLRGCQLCLRRSEAARILVGAVRPVGRG